jgi:hypothetical protein
MTPQEVKDSLWCGKRIGDMETIDELLRVIGWFSENIRPLDAMPPSPYPKGWQVFPCVGYSHMGIAQEGHGVQYAHPVKDKMLYDFLLAMVNKRFDDRGFPSCEKHEHYHSGCFECYTLCYNKFHGKNYGY